MVDASSHPQVATRHPANSAGRIANCQQAIPSALAPQANACTLRTAKMKGLLEFRSHHLSQGQQPIQVLINLLHLLVLLHSPPSSRKWLGPRGAILQGFQLHLLPLVQKKPMVDRAKPGPLLQKGDSLAARPELLINKGIYLPLFSFSRPSQTLQLEVLHQHPQTNLHQNTHRYQAQHLDPATKLSIWFNPLSLKLGCLDVGYQIMSGSSGIKPIILVCACVCVCACVANTGASRPLPRAIAGQRNIRQSKQSCFCSRFST